MGANKRMCLNLCELFAMKKNYNMCVCNVYECMYVHVYEYMNVGMCCNNDYREGCIGTGMR